MTVTLLIFIFVPSQVEDVVSVSTVADTHGPTPGLTRGFCFVQFRSHRSALLGMKRLGAAAPGGGGHGGGHGGAGKGVRLPGMQRGFVVASWAAPPKEAPPPPSEEALAAVSSVFVKARRDGRSAERLKRSAADS